MRKKYTLLFMSVLLVFGVHSQEATSINDKVSTSSALQDSLFSHQLKLVNSIRQFIRTDLKLNIKDDFYTDWSDRSDSMYVFLYVSRNDTIETPNVVAKGLLYFNTEGLAIAKSNELRKQGYQTLIYKTVGLSNALLNRKLLSYSDEAIAFILFHEATHRHIGMEIDYMYVEALCDAMANQACIRFAQKTKMLDMKKVLKQKMIFENAYALLNKKRIEIDKTTINKKQNIFNNCSSKIHSLIRNANQFQKDRMGYEVNNAYFLRVEAYAIHYFEMKEQLGDNLDINKVTAGLPKIKSQKQSETKTIELLPNPANSSFQW